MAIRDQVLRLFVAAPFLVVLVRWRSFVDHVTYFLSGDVSRALITGNWWLVAANVILFCGFLVFLSYRRRIDWRHTTGFGVYSAFIVSLFVEMYGVPLTIFLGSGLISGPGTPPATVLTVDVFGTVLAMNLWMLLGVLVTLLGMHLIGIGWWQVYRSDGLVTDGLYAYSRNPQYLGIILIALGWVIGWPTVLTLALFPVLVVAYRYLAKTEESDMLETYGEDYETYMADVPRLL